MNGVKNMAAEQNMRYMPKAIFMAKKNGKNLG